MGREWELKYAATPETLDRIAADKTLAARAVGAAALEMESVYFDTPAGDLKARKWTLRLRRENGRGVVTMKTAGDGGARGEWEYEADSIDGAAEKLAALGAPQELKALLAAGVAPVCGASFTRQAITLELGGTAAELALDLGFLFRGERKAPLCEVELELKFGDESAVKELADELAAKYELSPEPRSKFVRASNL
ncbi:MAG: CYTH domain-containing protein [Oscillospiraceae bacterium]|nr:CYTH domain-containing protein [Oscillospiraceae bacterium]